MSYEEFWMAVYIAAIRAGNGTDNAMSKADDALSAVKLKFRGGV